MQRNQKTVSASGVIVLMMVLINTIILEQGLISSRDWYLITFFTIPLLLIAIVAFRRKISKQRSAP